MGKNAVQFLKGMSLVAFQEQYGTEAQCRAALAAWRWPGGFQCDRCGHRGHAYLATRPVWQCNRCKRQVSLTSGTLLAHTRLPLRVWFLAIFLLTQSKTGRSALALSRELGIGYDAAWLLKHKLMRAMVEREGRRQLAGWVQLDDAYFGGERRGGPRGRGADGKQAFVAAVQCSEEGHPEVMRLDVVKGFSADEIGAWATRHLAPDTVVVSDALAGFNAVGEVAGTSHRRISTSGYAVVTLELDSSQVVSQTFAWSRQGTVLLPSDAGAINAWLANYDGQIVDAVVSITGLQATNPTGANSFVAEAQYMGQVQGGFAYGWYNNGGGGCTDCVIK